MNSLYVVVFVVVVILLGCIPMMEHYGSPYGSRMTKKKGEPCEVPDECESLACSGHMGQDDRKTCAY